MHQDSKQPPVLNWCELSQQLLPRSRDAHKGNFGHVLVVGGDYGMAGAVRLSAEAALRVGAGLVSVTTRETHCAFVCTPRPEIMCYGITNIAALSPLITKATVIVIGPGLGQSDWSRTLFTAILSSGKPLVVDADALNLLSESPRKSDHWILTPHPGEAARLLRCTVTAVQKNRVSAISQLVNSYGGIIVLKGADTLVQGDDAPYRCAAGNPGMSSSGMGDVLSGVIAGLLAQQFSPIFSAKMGVLLHAMAGDLAVKENGERGLLAMDLMPYLRKLVNTDQQKHAR